MEVKNNEISDNWYDLISKSKNNAYNCGYLLGENNLQNFLFLRDYIGTIGLKYGVEISYSRFEKSYCNLFLKFLNNKLKYTEFVNKFVDSLIRNYKDNGYINNKELNKFLRRDFKKLLNI